jgi:FkbM family methyltransferase
MIRHKIRGGGRLLSVLDRFGYFKRKIVKYELKKNYSVFVPIYRPERWDRIDLIGYERALVAALVHAATECTGSVTIVDCGADIGLISVAVSAELNRVSKIVAFEPSDEAFPVLQKTLAGLPFETKAIQVGVSDFTGRGELRSPPYDASHHARYLVQVPQGGFPVTTIDALSLKAVNLILKIDVEGGEIGVVRGALRSLTEAEKAIVSVEAHPKVFGRTGIDPIMILREIAAIRPFQFTVAETGKSDLDLSRPFFEQQANDGTIYNIVCSSR